MTVTEFFKANAYIGRCAVVAILCGLSFVAEIEAQVPGQPAPRPNGPPTAQAPRNPGARPPGPPTAQPPAPAAPFQLTREEAAFLDQVLVAWEQQTSKIKTFKSKFIRWKYDRRDQEISMSEGELSYKDPDKGTYRIDKVSQKKPEGEYEEVKNAVRDHWTTDGKVIHIYEHAQKEVRETPIPEEMQGQSIRNSPLPFVFGANPIELKQRYWLRVITPQQFLPTEIWLEAYPRFLADAQNFKRTIIRLNRTNFQPVALRLVLPPGEYDSYKFEDISINPLLPNWRELFSPKIPRGWKIVREAPPAPVPVGRQPAATANRIFSGQAPAPR